MEIFNEFAAAAAAAELNTPLGGVNNNNGMMGGDMNSRHSSSGDSLSHADATEPMHQQQQQYQATTSNNSNYGDMMKKKGIKSTFYKMFSQRKKSQKYRAPTTPVKSAANESPSSSPVESNYYSLESSIKTESDKRIKKKYSRF